MSERGGHARAPLVEAAPAKINLHLRILSREPDGYHRLETLFQALALHDTLEATPAETSSLTVDGDVDTGPAEDNLVLRAARAYVRAVPTAPAARIRLVKRIPAGAGLGGGSSDAAAGLRLMNRMAGSPLDDDALRDIGASLGSDVPFFLCGSAMAWAEGRGEQLEPLPPPPPVPVVVVDPGFPVATPAAFRWWDERVAEEPATDRTQDARRPRLPAADFAAIAAAARNDFEDVVLPRHPALGRIRDALRAGGATVAMLSGSGSCVYGIFRDEEAASAVLPRIATLQQGARALLTRTAS